MTRAIVFMILAFGATAHADEVARLERQLADQRAIAQLTMDLLIDELNRCREEQKPVVIKAQVKKMKIGVPTNAQN